MNIELKDINPLVSVCITTYMHKKYIYECVMSVVTQNADANIEILIGDDCSDDGTRDVLLDLHKTYPDLIRIYFHEKNLGASKNLAFLIEQSRGGFIAHLDGDDFWLPGKLSQQLTQLALNPDCVAVYSNAKVITDSGEDFATFNSGVPEKFDLTYLVSSGNFLFHSSLLYRAIYKNRILDIDGSFIDYQIHIRLALNGNILYIDRKLAVYRNASGPSMLKTMPVLVHQCYWRSLFDAYLAVPKAAHSAAELFWERLVLSSVRNGWLAYLVVWWKTIGNDKYLFIPKSRRLWLAVRSIRLIPDIIISRFTEAERRILYKR